VHLTNARIIIIIIIIRAEFEAPKDKRKRNKRNVTLEPSFTQSPNTNLSFTSTISCHSSHLDLQWPSTDIHRQSQILCELGMEGVNYGSPSRRLALCAARIV